MEKATVVWLKAFLLLVGGVLVSQSLLPPSQFSTFNRARCQAFCFTQFPGIRSNNEETCNSDCEGCLVPCKGKLQTVEDCNGACANDACKSSCQFIASNLGDESSYTETISPPGAPTVLGTNFTSVSLSWQRPSNVTIGTIVYIVEMKYEGDLSGDWRTLNIITSSPLAVVTDFFLCLTIPSFYSNIFRFSYDGISYQFRIVALAANTSASRSFATRKLQLPSPPPVENAKFKILHYADSRGDNLYFFGKWKSSSDGVDKYYVNWQVPNSQCFSSFGRSPSRTRKENAPNITFNVRHDQRNGCPNTFKVYALDGCSFSRPTVVTVINHGCRNISNYPPAECCKVHPPNLENQNDLLVRNLRRGPLSVSKDFKFSFNITWDPPVYFRQSGCQVLQRKYSIRYGDPTKFSPCFGPFCSFVPKQWGTVMSIEVNAKSWEVKGINQGDTFKFTIVTVVSKRLGSQTKTQINFTMEPNSDDLKVQGLAVTFVTTPRSVRSKVTWRKPSLDSGFVKHYLISYKDENDNVVTRTTNTTTFTIDDTQLQQTLPVQVTPVYSSSKFVGISTQVNASPNQNKVWNFQSKWEDIPGGPVLRISWDKPATPLKIVHYVLNYDIRKPGFTEQLLINTVNTFIIIRNLTSKDTVHLQVTPNFDSSAINGVPSSYTFKTPSDCDLRKPCKNGATCIDKGSGYECSCASGFSGKNCEIGSTETQVRNLKSEWKNGALLISWDKPANQIRVSYYIVNYEIQKPGAVERYFVNTTELRVTVGERNKGEEQWDIKFKVKAVFTDPSVKGFFSEEKKAPSILARIGSSDKKLSKVETIGLVVGLGALVLLIFVLTVVIIKCRNQLPSYKSESFKLDQQ